jgi:pyruvate/2-oxoglutarate dehydrogenase complex dihydrolipoamide dehydrogenase (E3) component
MQYGDAPFAEHAAAIKRSVAAVPVLYAGRVNDPVLAEELLASGAVDLVGMTRAMLADPDMPAKTRAGRLEEIRKCIGCNTCIGRVVHGEVKTPLCAVNPVVGHEAEWARMQPAAAPKKVVVVGGGPAGLEAARVAGLRGHAVTLLEREPELGGMTRLAARAPRRESFLFYRDYAGRELDRLGVEVCCGVAADVESVLALQPDVVVVATGATPRRRVAASGAAAFDFGEVMRGGVDLGKRTVVVSEDDHMITPSVADFIATQGVEVEILHKWLSIGDQIERYTRGIVFHRLAAAGVVIHPSKTFAGFADGVVRARCSHTGQSLEIAGVDSVVWSLGMESEDGLARALKGRVSELYNVGSSFAPRFMAEATQHGANVGRMI